MEIILQIGFKLFDNDFSQFNNRECGYGDEEKGLVGSPKIPFLFRRFPRNEVIPRDALFLIAHNDNFEPFFFFSGLLDQTTFFHLPFSDVVLWLVLSDSNAFFPRVRRQDPLDRDLIKLLIRRNSQCDLVMRLQNLGTVFLIPKKKEDIFKFFFSNRRK